ncbi:two-component system sensor histidine kinase [Bacteroides pyogenes JCM 6292]|uniref:histidine kinase n=1 Tax=Bacteroides pyogenes JCM 6292 TaxID=1235809 RepID=W4P7H7_9BACE|nr:two-component system sensor histidine kinase [Bacteroides pyogenes JCM 6292]
MPERPIIQKRLRNTPFLRSCPIRQTTLKAFEEKKSFSDLEATVEIKLNGNQETTCNTVISGTYLLLDGEENMVITVHDVTKQKRTEEELKIAKEKAEKANLSKSAFLANMSHEIRTPINAITGFSEILSYTNVEEEKTQYKEIIKMNADLLLQLVNDILDLSKIEAGTIDFTYTNIDINQLLSDLRQLFQMRIAHTEKNNKIEIITELGLSACLIKTDQNRLIQVLSNFIANAIKFTESGNIRIGYQAKENELYFYVSDTGSGIPQDRLQDIFERFVKLNKEEKNGTGLGLAISKGIINKLGGRIGVESEIGKGSTFWFTLPLCPDCDLTERSNFLKSFN